MNIKRNTFTSKIKLFVLEAKLVIPIKRKIIDLTMEKILNINIPK